MVNLKKLVFGAIVIIYVLIALSEFVPWVLLTVFSWSPLSVGISDVIFRFFSLFCHQLPYRSLFYDGIQMPDCARCASIYVATALGLIFFWLKGFGDKEFKMNWVLFALLLAPTGIDGTTQLFGWRESTNPLRLVTGVPYGLAYAYILAWAVPFIYALLLLIYVALKRDEKRTGDMLYRVKYMAWPFTKKKEQ